jgi:tetratricopeptide (TPR) repeat protein
MACEELWKRLCPDALSVSMLEDEVEAIVNPVYEEDQDFTEKETDQLMVVFEKYRDFMLDETGRLKTVVREQLERRYWDMEFIFGEIPMYLLNQKRYELSAQWGLILYQAFSESACLRDAGEAKFRLGKIKEAEKLFRRVYKEKKDPYGLMNLALCYEEECEFEKAKTILGELKLANEQGEIKMDKEDIEELQGRQAELKEKIRKMMIN